MALKTEMAKKGKGQKEAETEAKLRVPGYDYERDDTGYPKTLPSQKEVGEMRSAVGGAALVKKLLDEVTTLGSEKGAYANPATRAKLTADANRLILQLRKMENLSRINEKEIKMWEKMVPDATSLYQLVTQTWKPLKDNYAKWADEYARSTLESHGLYPSVEKNGQTYINKGGEWYRQPARNYGFSSSQPEEHEAPEASE